MTWTICHLFKSLLLTAAATQVEDTFISLWVATLFTFEVFGFQLRTEVLVRVAGSFFLLVFGQAFS